MPDWEPAPPSARLRAMAAALSFEPNPMLITAGFLREIAADVDAMERRLAEYARKERADAE